MPLKDHIHNTLRINPEPTPLFKMLLSGIVITFPLIVGQYFDQLFVSMFGSLMGLVYYLNDHFDPMLSRFKHLLTTFLLLMLALIVGAYCFEYPIIIFLILFVLSFFVGKSKNYGIELERLTLFITLQFLTASSPPMIKDHLAPLISYSFLAFLNYLFWAFLLYRFMNHKTVQSTSKRATLKRIMDHNKSLTFPLACAVFCSLGFVIAQYFHLSHANWIIGTALIVMLPDSYQSIYKSVQRLLGTIAGVIIASVILNYVHDPKSLIAFVFIFSFLMPHGLHKNYWVGNIYIAALILFFLQIAVPLSISKEELALWRIIDIALGSFIGVCAALTMKPEIVKKLIKKSF